MWPPKLPIWRGNLSELTPLPAKQLGLRLTTGGLGRRLRLLARLQRLRAIAACRWLRRLPQGALQLVPSLVAPVKPRPRPTETELQHWRRRLAPLPVTLPCLQAAAHPPSTRPVQRPNKRLRLAELPLLLRQRAVLQ